MLLNIKNKIEWIVIEMYKNKRYYIQYLAAFTLVFCIMFLLCYGVWFWKYNKLFFRSYDGLDQHYLSFIYIGNILRDAINNLINNGDFQFQMWNFGIGYGSDVITSLAAYLPDPFNWISVFFPGKYSEIGYDVMIALKVMASGLAFSWYCFEKDRDRFSTLMGAILYMFSGTMYIVFIESFFVNPMYIFPFVAAGVDRLWEERSSKLYVFSLAFAFINYFYFAYMMCIIICIQISIKVYIERKQLNLALLLIRSKRFIINSLIALSLSAFITLPVYLVLKDISRLGVSYYLPVLFNFQFYSGLISGFINPYGMLGRDCIVGYGFFAFIGVCILLIKTNDYLQEKIMFMLLSIGLCIPLVGSLMNGLSYTANRWIWAYAFVTTYMVTLAIPLFEVLNKKDKCILLLCSLTYILITRSIFQDNSQGLAISLLFLLISNLFIYKINLSIKRNRKILISLGVVISVCINSFCWFYAKQGNATREDVERGKAFNSLCNNPYSYLIENIDKTSGVRYDSAGFGKVRNISWLFKVSGIDFYISIYNNKIEEFHKSLGILTGCSPMDYSGLNRRSELGYLMNIDEFIVENDNKSLLPIGYTRLVDNKEKYFAYGSNLSNSLVHGFNKLIDYKKYLSLTPYERQQALTIGCIVNDIKENDNVQVKNFEKTFALKLDKGVFYHDGKIDISKPNIGFSLNAPSIRKSEVYLYVDGVNSRDGYGCSFTVQPFYKGTVIDSGKIYRYTANNKTHMYGGKHSWLINLGVLSDVDQISVVFHEAGRVELKTLKLYAKPVLEIENTLKSIPSLTNDLVIKNNSICFSLNNTLNKYALISIPYSTGWKAYVDGKERKIFCADEAFMMLKLTSSDKNIVLEYRTPGLLVGCLISLLTLLCYCYFAKKTRKV